MAPVTSNQTVLTILPIVALRGLGLTMAEEFLTVGYFAPGRSSANRFPMGSRGSSLNTVKRNEGLLKPNDVRFEQSQKK